MANGDNQCEGKTSRVLKWLLLLLIFGAVVVLIVLASIHFNDTTASDRQININHPAARAPQITVAAAKAPEVHIAPANVNVAPAVVNMEQLPPVINIHNNADV